MNLLIHICNTENRRAILFEEAVQKISGNKYKYIQISYIDILNEIKIEVENIETYEHIIVRLDSYGSQYINFKR